MNRMSFAVVIALSAVLACPVARAQMTQGNIGSALMKHDVGVPSTTLTVTGLDGTTRTLTAIELMAMPQTTVTVMDGHSHKPENYSGVAVKDLLALVAPAKIIPVASPDPTMKAKVSPRMTVIVARGTDNFRVVLTLCDTDPGCRSGQSIVADTMEGKPLTIDGTFKLILTEDKMPGRWVRNLDALTEKNLGNL